MVSTKSRRRRPTLQLITMYMYKVVILIVVHTISFPLTYLNCCCDWKYIPTTTLENKNNIRSLRRCMRSRGEVTVEVNSSNSNSSDHTPLTINVGAYSFALTWCGIIIAQWTHDEVLSFVLYCE